MEGLDMQFVLGVTTLCAAIVWIGYVALTVMALAEPRVQLLAFWILATPVMALIGVGVVRSIDRIAYRG
jgi:pheromone shutdown protein TraB